MLNILSAQTITFEGSEVWKDALEICDENSDLGEIRLDNMVDAGVRVVTWLGSLGWGLCWRWS